MNEQTQEVMHSPEKKQRKVVPQKASNKFYRFCYRTAGPVIRLFRPFEVLGKENMISGAAMICSNHSAMIDPFQIALSFGIDTNIHVIAKIELFRIPVIATILWKLGMICVDRSINDIASIKTSLNYFKNGEKVVIFPEGTRLSEYHASAAKSGAVKLAERAGVPIIPVFLSRRKPVFRKSKVIFGEPYYIEKQKEKRTLDEYARLSEELMSRIQSLDLENQ